MLGGPRPPTGGACSPLAKLILLDNLLNPFLISSKNSSFVSKKAVEISRLMPLHICSIGLRSGE
ncbi:hypothetical protein AKJ37_05090 [candidate division MSBL1 archaeon SCGC-AAA259I09]|uniref:Uncharacterized protein n=1 Tax=candidate division MSBL1 archaeon SCGC-AAA259I09 TaxID=1698267 RepID=A0A133UQU0_9EURY|nr:hypothetical protein AKJ37_05090 [candidate division MSBL1 archaeon SCGC-AAA259I09]